MRLDINYRKKICKKYKHMEAKQYTETNTESEEKRKKRKKRKKLSNMFPETE